MSENSSEQSVENLQQLQEFLFEFRNEERMVTLPSGEPENDVDHSFFLAMHAWMLAERIGLNVEKIIKYAMVHDLVEAYASDTFAFDEEHKASKDEREHRAFLRIKDEFKESFPAMTDSIAEYEQKADREARFVYALDKLMPSLLSLFNNGADWKRHGITMSQLEELDEPRVSASDDVLPIFKALNEIIAETYPEIDDTEN